MKKLIKNSIWHGNYLKWLKLVVDVEILLLLNIKLIN
jgi:hypothetical protein